MNQTLTSKILEILNNVNSQKEKALQIESLVNSVASELIREDREKTLSVDCPMCMTAMDLRAEIGFGDTFVSACKCKGCKRSFTVHGNYRSNITRIVSDKEPPCTGLQ